MYNKIFITKEAFLNIFLIRSIFNSRPQPDLNLIGISIIYINEILVKLRMILIEFDTMTYLIYMVISRS